MNAKWMNGNFFKALKVRPKIFKFEIDIFLALNKSI